MTTSIRKPREILDPQTVMEGAGVRLRRSFGPSIKNPLDPFLLFDHFAFNDPIEGPIAGFPKHPHRGIETVTYMLAGSTRHRDSLGNLGVIGPGDVQWMTSGSGILHEEMPKRGPDGRVRGFQLWVNLPASEKMSRPRYQGIEQKDIPVVERDGVEIRVIAGTFEGVKGPVGEIAARPIYMDVTLQPVREFRLKLPAEHTALAYLFEGTAQIGLEAGAEPIQSVKMIWFEAGDQIRVATGPDAGARLLLIAGAPFQEPIYPYGPFVMNTKEEIEEAIHELRTGNFVKEGAGWKES